MAASQQKRSATTTRSNRKH